MDLNRITMETSLLEWNKRTVVQPPNRESEYNNAYASLPGISTLSGLLKSAQDSSQVQDRIVKDLQLKVYTLNVTCDIFNDMLRKLNADLAQVKADRDTMAAEMSTLKRVMFNSLDRRSSDINDQASEIEERYQRSKNILVYNIRDSMGETPEMLKALVADLLTTLRFNREFPEVNRIGHYRRHTRPILLSFKSPDYVKMVIKNKTQLRFSKEWKSVLIAEDRTVNQRLQMKYLQSQASETVW